MAERFEKVFAPRTEIHIFHDIKGWAFDSVRIPSTQQVIVGLSVALYHDVANHIFEQTGRQIDNEFVRRRVHGPKEPIPIPQLISVVDCSEPLSPFAPPLEVLWLEPKPF